MEILDECYIICVWVTQLQANAPSKQTLQWNY